MPGKQVLFREWHRAGRMPRNTEGAPSMVGYTGHLPEQQPVKQLTAGPEVVAPGIRSGAPSLPGQEERNLRGLVSCEREIPGEDLGFPTEETGCSGQLGSGFEQRCFDRGFSLGNDHWLEGGG